MTGIDKTPHQGQNVRRFRELLDMKQEGLAQELGGDWTQKKVSLLEGKETIDPLVLAQVARALRVPVEAIKNLNEEAAINNIACTFSDNAAVNYKPTFNPIDKLQEAMEEIKRLNAALLKEKDEKIALLERLLADKSREGITPSPLGLTQ